MNQINAAIEKLPANIKDQFSADEIKSFMELGEQVGSPAVLELLLSTIKEGPNIHIAAETNRDHNHIMKIHKESEAKCQKLSKKIMKHRKYERATSLVLEFNEIKAKLYVALVPAVRNYKPEIYIPHESYTMELMTYYEKLKSIAGTYWQQFKMQNTALFNQIAEYRADVDFTTLITDPKIPTSMYFDPNGEKRISIFCYYMLDGKPCYYSPE